MEDFFVFVNYNVCKQFVLVLRQVNGIIFSTTFIWRRIDLIFKPNENLMIHHSAVNVYIKYYIYIIYSINV